MEHKNVNMTVKDLRKILRGLPSDMAVVMPVISEDDCNYIFGFRHIRTAGILYSEYEPKYSRVLAVNAARDSDISEQIKNRDAVCEKVLF